LPNDPSKPTRDAASILLCDWNGTLVNDIERAWQATCAVLLAHGRPRITMKRFREAFQLPLTAFFTTLGLEGDAHTAVEQWNDALTEIDPTASEHAEEMLDHVTSRGITVGVVSAARSDVVRADIEVLGVRSHIRFVLGGVDSKPDVLTALVASSAGQVTYLGDTEYDMRAANSAGAMAIGYARGYRPASALRHAGADIVVHDLRDVGALILADGG
jgi:phosphoglycolate phosphatase